MIDGYLAELDRRLHGCGRFKADLLAEARDGLHDAADAYRAGGWSTEEAERRAVADFGPAAVVARDYQAELGMLSGVRTLWKLVLGVPAMQIAWDYARILTFGEWSRLSTPTPEWYKVIAHASHGAVFLVPVVGLLALLGTRWLSRRLDGPRLSRFCGALIAFAVGVNLASVGLLVGATGVVDISRLFLSVPCALLMIAWVLLSVRLVVLARRSWGRYATIVA
ncbi:permease prefix domain 1-containing protein [Amycolatopsis sp. NEAU-NG30]|uniref:Permease prefix domain 1-containing protein n=1 Tax=Amycolatopsis melonis TaxID=3156488 RepID=A0ABV0LN92_9PSEU